jgi:hypothetical protein
VSFEALASVFQHHPSTKNSQWLATERARILSAVGCRCIFLRMQRDSPEGLNDCTYRRRRHDTQKRSSEGIRRPQLYTTHAVKVATTPNNVLMTDLAMVRVNTKRDFVHADAEGITTGAVHRIALQFS